MRRRWVLLVIAFGAFGAFGTSVALAALSAAPAAAQAPEPMPSASPPVERLTLDQSVAIAVENATLVRKAQNNAKLSGEQVLQGYAQFLPNLSAGASYSYNTGKTLYTISGVTLVDSKNQSANYQISTTLNLFNGLADYSALKGALDRRKASDLNLSWARQQIAIDVTQTYLQIVLDGLIIGIARKNLEASSARLKLLQGQAEVGQASPADLLRQEAQRSADQLYLVNSQTKFHDDKLLLIRKLSLDTARNYDIENPSLEPVTPAGAALPESDLIRTALDRRQDLQAEQSIVSATDWDITNARSGYFPRLDFGITRLAGGRYLLSQLVNGQDALPANQVSLIPQLGQQVSYSLGLTLSWNIFDRFVTRLNVQRARTTWENTRIDYDDLRLAVISEVRQVRSDYAAAVSQLETARVGLQAAEKAYATVVGRYRVGASSFIDVLAAQSALVQAQANQAQAMVNLKLQEKLFEYYLGASPYR